MAHYLYIAFFILIIVNCGSTQQSLKSGSVSNPTTESDASVLNNQRNNYVREPYRPPIYYPWFTKRSSIQMEKYPLFEYLTKKNQELQRNQNSPDQPNPSAQVNVRKKRFITPYLGYGYGGGYPYYPYSGYGGYGYGGYGYAYDPYCVYY